MAVVRTAGSVTRAGAQDFSFIGVAAFTAAGQVRAQVISNTYVFANTDADLGTTEFSMVLVGR